MRLQRLRLRNNSSRRRKLTVTSYATLVLGSDPEQTGMHLVTKWDLQSQSIFARNALRPGISVGASPLPPRLRRRLPSPATALTFIGRNHSLRDPVAMEHERLTGDVGAGLDPCAAVQVQLEIDPGQTGEVIFLLGQTDDEAQAQRARANDFAIRPMSKPLSRKLADGGTNSWARSKWKRPSSPPIFCSTAGCSTRL